MPGEYFEARERALLGTRYDVLYAAPCAVRRGVTVNGLRCAPQEFAAAVDFGLEPSPFCDAAFLLTDPQLRPGRHAYHHAGVFYVQEPSASVPAGLLGVRPGERVLDLCAAPGGKTSQLAAALRGEGLLVANEYVAARAGVLKSNLERMGVTNALVLNESTARVAAAFPAFFDKVLVDAPCSGEGMFRKEPSMAADWSPEEVQRYSTLQKEILHAAARMVRPGGYLLYSTCTYSPEENEQVVETLLTSGRDTDTENVQASFACAKETDEEETCGLFQLKELPLYPGVDRGHPEWSRTGEESLTCCRRFWNHRVKGEGQFAALLRRVDETESPEKAPGPFIPAQGGLTGEMRDFFAHCRLAVPEERLQFLKERVFLLPEGCPDLSGLRVVRSGLYLGDCKKKRFEPGQALAMALRKEEYDNVLSLPLSDERVERYLRGETIQADGPDGWVLVCVEELPLGWGKSSRGNIKNKIEPGWRKQ